MMAETATCAGCIYAAQRLKYSKPRRYCQRYHQIRDERCIDFRTKPSAVKVALDYLKRIATK